ncbi:MAG TPA: hypothetical protein VIL18_06485 [Longimicrobiales bacterium]
MAAILRTASTPLVRAPWRQGDFDLLQRLRATGLHPFASVLAVGGPRPLPPNEAAVPRDHLAAVRRVA